MISGSTGAGSGGPFLTGNGLPDFVRLACQRHGRVEAGIKANALLAWHACRTFNARRMSPLLNLTRLSIASGSIRTSSLATT